MYAVQEFVLSVMKRKKIKKQEIVKMTGYTNISKGCTKFYDFVSGNDFPKLLIDNLHIALDVPEEEIGNSPMETEDEINIEIKAEKEEIEIHERENFVPFLYCHTERKIPSPIFACAITRADRYKVIELPADYNSIPEKKQEKIRKALIKELMERFNGAIPTFGEIICFVLKREYNDEEADREVYDLKGDLIINPENEFRKISIGISSISVNGKNIAGMFRKI